MSKKLFLSANEAVAWAAYRAGCRVAAAYPGTPSTEIMENIAKFKDVINCEWAVNEKVAMEVAIGASIAGVRALTAMKHVGLNVAMDPLMTFTYVGASGGFVLITADDPGMHSSQNEQDNRVLAKFARCPTFEPADSQEAFDMTMQAFEISEAFQVPAVVRLTTRTSHASGVVDVGSDEPGAATTIPYVKNIQRNIPVPAFSRPMRLAVEKRTAALRDASNASPLNRVDEGHADLGIITSGVTYQYVKEIFPEYAVLKLGFSWPLPDEVIKKFAASVKRLVVVEEGDPVLEEQIRAMGLPVVDVQTELRMLELNPMRLAELRRELCADEPAQAAAETAEALSLPNRPPVLCAGCSHRGAFYILHKLGATATGDIGCYTLGAFPPLSSLDSCICMGAAIGNAAGMRKAELPNKRIAAVMGDSTFFHSGMTGLLDAAYNKSPITLVVLDNRITAMTGHQDNPGTGRTLMGEATKEVRIADIAQSFGIARVHEVDAYDLAVLESTLKECLDSGEVAVVIVKGPCVVYKRMVGTNVYHIDADTCMACGACFRLGCPAIVRGEAKDAEKGRYKACIDQTLCTGCDLCRQVCKFNAISPVAGKEG